MKTARVVSACCSLLIFVTLMPVAHAAIVWGGLTLDVVPMGGANGFKFEAKALHNSLDDDLYFDTFGVYANIGMPGDTWDGFADSESPVTDQNVNTPIGNEVIVGIYDGTYWMNAWLKADGSDIDYVSPSQYCYEYYQDCGN